MLMKEDFGLVSKDDDENTTEEEKNMPEEEKNTPAEENIIEMLMRYV